MNWLSKKSSSGKTNHFIPEQKIRDLSDNENPITFATGVDEDNDSNSFAEEVKNDFESNPRTETDDKSDYEMSRKIMDEADDIGESSLSDEEKMLDLYNLYQNYESMLSEAQKGIILGKIQGIDKNLRMIDKNNKTANKIQHDIQKLIYASDVPEQRKIAEQKSERIQERQNSSEPSNSNFERKDYGEDDWLERSAKIAKLAES